MFHSKLKIFKFLLFICLFHCIFVWLGYGKDINAWSYEDEPVLTHYIGNKVRFNYPYAVRKNSKGDIFVTNVYSHNVHKYSGDGDFILSFGTYGSGDGEFNFPRGITFDKDDNVYIVDSLNHRVQKFDSEGNFVMAFGSEGSGEGDFFNPRAISVDTDGNVWVCDTNNNRIQGFTNKGVFIMSFGTIGDDDGEFLYPRNVDSDRIGNLYVADRQNNRFQKFSFDREPPVLNMETASNQTVYSSLQQLSAKFTDNLTPITSVEYKIGDGEWKSCTALSGEFTLLEEDFVCDFSSDINEDGEYTIFIIGTDSKTNTSEAEEISFIFDTTAPEVVSTAKLPKGINVESGQVVTINPYIIKANVADNLSGVQKVEFYIDENLVCTVTEPNAGLYECAWDTEKYQTDIRLVMYDRAGNVGELEVLGVEVDSELARTGSSLFLIWYLLGLVGVLGAVRFKNGR